MLARFFQKSKPISFISLLGLLFLYVFVYSFPGFSFQEVVKNFGVFLLFTAIILLVDFVINKNELTDTNYFALFVFIILLGLFPEVLSISKISFAHFFILLSFRRLFSLRTGKNTSLKLFDSGFFIGVAFLLYPASIILVIAIYASYFLYIQILDKHIFIPVVGFLTPVFLAFTYYFLTDNIAAYKTLTEINIGYYKYDELAFLIPIGVISFLTVIAIIKNLTMLVNLDNNRKKGGHLIIITFILTLLMLLINTAQITENIQFVFFPIAVLLGNLIGYTQKKWLQELLVAALLIFSFVELFL